MKCEKLVSKFVKSVDDLEIFDCRMHNADVANLIWKKMTNPDLIQYVTVPQGKIPTGTKGLQICPTRHYKPSTNTLRRYLHKYIRSRKARY